MCSLVFSDSEKRVDLGRCCPVPKQRGLPSSFFLFAGFRMVCVLFLSLVQCRGYAQLGTIPRTELFWYLAFYCLRSMLWGAVIHGVGYDQAERKALGTSPLGMGTYQWTAWCLVSWTTVAPLGWARSPSRQGARTRCGQRQELTVSVCSPHRAATNETHFVESAYASAWFVLLSRGADLAVIREVSTLRSPHSALGGRLHEVRPQALRPGFVKNVIMSLGRAPAVLCRAGTRLPRVRGHRTCASAQAPLAASRSRGDGHGVRRTSTLAWPCEAQRLCRMMLPAGVGRDTGAACARRHLF